MRIELASYDNSWYDPGKSLLVRSLWMFVGLPIFRSTYFASSRLRCVLLRLFGAKVGRNVVIRQSVSVKYPWHLVVGDHTWIGEQVWIDNLVTVTLGVNVCLSQSAYICTGNHDWADPYFGLRVAPVTVGDGAWAAARSTLLPGVTLHEGSIASAGSVVTRSVAEWEIVAGNPAVFVRRRVVQQQAKTSVVAHEVRA